MGSKENAKAKSNAIQFLGSPEIFNIYENIQSVEERIKMIYNSPMVQNLFKIQSETLKSEENAIYKSDKESKRLRDLGNTAFKQKRDQKAIELYTEALCHADPNGKDLAYGLALANRSAVHMRFGRAGLKRALRDIDLALKAGHPTPVKLYERKVSCLEDLGLVNEVMKSICLNFYHINANRPSSYYS